MVYQVAILQVEPIKTLMIMKAIRIENAPKSMVMVFVEYDITFAYNFGNILVMGTSNVEKFKAHMIKKGMASSEIESISFKAVELDEVSDVYDF